MKTGKVQGKTAERHTSAEFVDFLEQVIAGCQPHREIHIILNNLSAHKTNQVEEFLKRNANLKLHFTPTYSSWLNRVEIWFARLERDFIARGISLRLTTWHENSCATSARTPTSRDPSNENTLTLPAESYHTNELTVTRH